MLKIPGHGYRCARVDRDDSTMSIDSDLYTFHVMEEDQAPMVARGVLSGFVEDGRNGLRYMQTDATINPGSSGGPIFDASGHAVEIVVEKLFGYEGLGLAVPSDEIEDALRLTWEP